MDSKNHTHQIDGPLMSEAEAARYIGYKRRGLQHLRLNGRGPAYVQIGSHRIGYLKADLDAYLLAHRKCSAPDVEAAAARLCSA